MSEPGDDGIVFTPEEVQRAIDDVNFIAEKLGIAPDDTIIPAIQARLRRTLRMMQDVGDRDIFTQTLLALLNAPTYRDERRHLEAHPELLDPRSDSLLVDLIAQCAGQPRQVQVLSDHLDLLRDVRTRGGTAAAIREAYVNAHGGLVLDVAPWLEAIESQFRELRHAVQPDQTARVDLLRRALAHTQSEENFAPETLAELHGLLWEALDDSADVDSQQTQEEEIACLRTMLQTYTCERYPRQYARTQSNLGVVLHGRYAHTGDLADLGQSIAAYVEAVQHTSPGSLDRPMYLNDLGTGLQDRYTRGRNLTDLERSIAAYEEAVRLTPPGTLDRPMYLNNLGTGLRDRYARTSNLTDLQRAIQAHEEAVQESVSGSPNRPVYLNNLGIALRERYAQVGEPADLEQVIAVWEEVVQQTPPDSPHRLGYLSNLGIALRAHYALRGELVNLERAIGVWEEAVRESPSGSPNRPMFLNNLGTGLRERYALKGDMVDLERAIAVWEEAVRQTPHGSPDRPTYLNNLANGLRDRYARNGELTDLEQAVHAHDKAVQQTPLGSRDLPALLNDLGNGLRARYVRSGDLTDLERAIQTHDKAVQQTPPESPEMPGRLNNLGNALRERYALKGDMVDLERAIAVWEKAVQQTPHSSPSWPTYVSSLGNGLRARYASRGDMADLERAIAIWEKAIEQVPPGSPDLPALLNNLGAGLRDRYGRSGVPVDLERAIAIWEKAIEQVPSDSPDLPALLNNLGAGLRERYTRGGDLADLDPAIAAYKEAVQKTPLESPHRSEYLNNLANGLRDRFTRRGVPADLEQAITIYKEAVKHILPDSPHRPAYLHNLGLGLRDRYIRSGDPIDLERAVAAFADACQSGIAVTSEPVLRAARTWGNWALERKTWAEAVQAYTYGLEASEHLFQAQLLRTYKEAWLREAQGLHARAAYALAQVCDLPRAVATLEQGRARLLSQVLERDRADLEQLRMLAPAFYDQYVAATHRLEVLEAQDISGQIALPPGQTLADIIRQAREDLDKAVEAVRQVPGYEAFLTLPTFEQIQQAIVDAPLVYIAATPAGGLALIVFPAVRDATKSSESVADSDESEGRVTSIYSLRLDDLTEQALYDNLLKEDNDPALQGYINAYSLWREKPDDQFARTAWFTALEKTTHWLWDILMGPLIQTLTSQKATYAILLPHGLLGLLPLHAAWTEDNTTPTGRCYAMDAVTFSYAPNARALSAARATATHTASDALLAVDEPQPVTTADPLPNSAREVQAIVGHFASATTLRGANATREALLAILQPKEVPQPVSSAADSTEPSLPPVLHFSCHGIANFTEPLKSGLLLAHDEWLTLSDLLALRLPGARLVVLSACETGVPGTRLLDEVIGLPTGLMQAGVAGVVASLWSVSDVSTMLLLVRFYNVWRDEGVVPAEALRRAQMWVRDTTNWEKAEYFKGFLSELQGGLPRVPASNMPVAIAGELYNDLMLRRPNQRDFAHPYHWAAFGFTGV